MKWENLKKPAIMAPIVGVLVVLIIFAVITLLPPPTPTPTAELSTTPTPTAEPSTTPTPTAEPLSDLAQPTIVQLTEPQTMGNVATEAVPTSWMTRQGMPSMGGTPITSIFPTIEPNAQVLSSPSENDSSDPRSTVSYRILNNVEQLWVWVGARNIPNNIRGKEIGRIRVTFKVPQSAATDLIYDQLIPLIVGENIANENCAGDECVQGSSSEASPSVALISNPNVTNAPKSYVIGIPVSQDHRVTNVYIEHTGRFTLPINPPDIIVYGTSAEERQPLQPSTSADPFPTMPSSASLRSTPLCLDDPTNTGVTTYSRSNSSNNITRRSESNIQISCPPQTNESIDTTLPIPTVGITFSREVQFAFGSDLLAVSTDPTAQVKHVGHIKLTFGVPPEQQENLIAIHVAIAARNLCAYLNDYRNVRKGTSIGRIEPIFTDKNRNKFTISNLSLKVGDNIRQARQETRDTCGANRDLGDGWLHQSQGMYVRAGNNSDPVFNETDTPSPEGVSALRVDVATIVVPDYLRQMQLTNIVIYDDYDLHRRNGDSQLTHDPFIIVYGITLDSVSLEEQR
ncbi:MAG: hypothetical protein CV045_12405 [Cyanobacteria bacterium M5B4]|nr:MAG: hypothetical protein CV045_12405 [Cyanobacteria bacterium M5B4]